MPTQKCLLDKIISIRRHETLTNEHVFNQPLELYNYLFMDFHFFVKFLLNKKRHF